jgi:murein L,D-transpeptidase YafK
MEANKTYYLRFKTALKKTDSQFFMDFFEIVPTNVYNGTLPEDIW